MGLAKPDVPHAGVLIKESLGASHGAPIDCALVKSVPHPRMDAAIRVPPRSDQPASPKTDASNGVERVAPCAARK